MRTWKYLAAAMSVLLLAGAGCGARTTTDAKIDATVDGIMADQADEQAELKLEEKEAAQVEADDRELKAFGEATYEIE